MKIALCLPLAALALPATGHAAERRLVLTDFDRVRVQGNYRVDIVVGRGTSGVISGSSPAIDGVLVEVQDRTLVIRPEIGAWGDGDHGPVALRFTTAAVQSIWASGASVVTLTGMRGSDLSIAQNGASTLTVTAISGDRLNVAQAGSGTVTVAGRIAQATASLRGSGNLDAGGLAVDDLTLAVEGPGNMTAQARRSANVTASGSGEVKVAGSAACIVRNLGAGTVQCGKPRPIDATVP